MMYPGYPKKRQPNKYIKPHFAACKEKKGKEEKTFCESPLSFLYPIVFNCSKKNAQERKERRKNETLGEKRK